MSGIDTIQRLDREDEDIDVDEVEESDYRNGPLYDKIYAMAEKFAGTYVGQYVTGKTDRLLKLIEDTAKWSLPPKNKNASSTPLERPLPWIPFIALILMLRLVRISISIAGLFIGNAPLAPSDVVYFIQTRRRKLRAIRINGMKEIGKREQAQDQIQRGGLLTRLKSILSMAICRPKLDEDTHKIFVSQDVLEEAGSSGAKKTQQNHNSSKNQCFEDEDISDHELTLNEILDKYGDVSNEDDDSDFVPPSSALNDADTSSSSTTTATSFEDKNNEEEYPESELNQLTRNANTDSNVPITNGNISVESHEFSMEAKENGEHSDTKLRKPKIMPKPIKDEPVPLPIQEIKQEPVENDEDTITNRLEFENSEDLNVSKDYNPHHQEQSELENDCKGPISKDIKENGKEQQIEKLNGDQKHIQSEIFVTPATSAEDLFFSPVGSPDLCGAYGFHPTSILKNYQTVNQEKRGLTHAFAENEDFIQGESTNESAATSRPTKSTNNPGKPIKNKFRGKRR